MLPLKLPPWDVDFCRGKLPELLEPRPNYGCWVGSISASSDAQRLAEYISMAKAGDVQGLMHSQQMGGDLVYTVLLNLSENNWRLALIESPESPSVNERVVFSTVIHLEKAVEVCRRDLSKVEEMLKRSCKVSVKDVIKQWMSR